MAIPNLDDKGIFLKTVFDGYDFIQHDIGKSILNAKFYNMILLTTFMPKLYENADLFITYCNQNEQDYISKELGAKYGVGIYNLRDCNDPLNPWANKPYVLFNSKYLHSIYRKIKLSDDIKFYVCPSYNEQNQIDAIGFRICEPSKVNNSFKWLFTCGNNIIYGKNFVNKEKECYIVEGFRDYVALKELGYNVIGLGSIVISKVQEDYINSLSNPILLLDNDDFGLKKSLQYKDKYRIAMLTNTEEKDAYDAWIKYGKINIREIK